MLEVVDASLAVGAAGGERALVARVSLSVAPGQMVALVGENGCGKSSLASLMCAGRLCSAGRVAVDGVDPAAGDAARLEVRRLVGLVRQNPVDQIVSSTVADEVAFGPRNLGLEPAEVERRVRRSLELAGLVGFEGRDTSALSGGEQQRLATAGVLAMQPRYIIFDEATSMLDASLRSSMRALYTRLAHEEGLGVVLITHDPVEVLECDRVYAMHAGTVAWSGEPWNLLAHGCGIAGDPLADGALPQAFRAVLRLGFEPVEYEPGNRVDAAFSWLSGAYERGAIGVQAVVEVRDLLLGEGGAGAWREADKSAPAADAALGIDARGLSFSYAAGEPVIRDLSLRAAVGRVLLIVGASGCGKSTLCSLVAGLAEPDEGRVLVGGEPTAPGRCGMAFQNPESQLFLNTVYDEIAFAPLNCGCPAEEVCGRAERAAALADVPHELFDRYPYELSGGQARRVAIASILSLDAAAYVFDEPTAGLDARGRERVRTMARKLAAAGHAVAVVSHDVDEWLDAVDDVALMSRGAIAWAGTAAQVRGELSRFEQAGVAVPITLAYAAALTHMLEGAGQKEGGDHAAR